ncbi:MAG: TetR family transcriptional regulator [Propionibacteriaceae bacterium]|nr:TetR family transcriptional regulator [Propionibacteriaceae bacterium]
MLKEDQPNEASFRRARTDAQRNQRREHILAIARELLVERRVPDLRLNELARSVGLAKASLLGYFGSREAVLLELARREYTEWVDELESAVGPQTPAQFAHVLAETATSRPLLSELLANLMTSLEHNVSTDEIIAFKRAMYDQIERLQRLLDAVTGSLSPERRLILVPGIHALIIEFHSLAHPSTALQSAAALDPRIHCGLPDHTGSLAAALTLYLTGARATD